MSIQYPELFEQRLAENKRMRSAVDGTIAHFDAWLKDSKLPFFTDYTDHGPDHLNRVMLTAAGGGYSRWGNFDITRWRADRTLDSWGTFCYIQEEDADKTISTFNRHSGSDDTPCNLEEGH